MTGYRKPLQGTFVAMLMCIAAVSHGADWPQFLGPQRNGVSSETGLIDAFPAAGPKELWRIAGGVGMSACAIEGELGCTLIQDEKHQILLAFHPETGAILWRCPLAPAYTNSMGDGPRATPTISNGTIFAYTGEGILAAVQATDGQLLWTQHPVRSHKGKPAEYGMACSPLVVKEQVIVTIGAPEATVASYDVKTGALNWKSGAGHSCGYSSPALLVVSETAQVVVFSGDAVLGIDPQEGSVQWEHAYVTDYNCNIAVPQSIHGDIFVSAGENHGSTLLAVSPAGQVTARWESQGMKSVLRNEWQTSVLLGGFLYGFDNVGSAGPVTHLTCIDAATGDVRWQQKRFGKGNLIAADGKLWISTMDGELVLVAARSDQFTELSRAQVIQTTRQSPVIASGRLYLRDNAEIVCFDIRKP